ncbi:MAG: T9SS type A sorting domain-containing protein [Cryomorphaceae bacterium]
MRRYLFIGLAILQSAILSAQTVFVKDVDVPFSLNPSNQPDFRASGTFHFTEGTTDKVLIYGTIGYGHNGLDPSYGGFGGSDILIIKATASDMTIEDRWIVGTADDDVAVRVVANEQAFPVLAAYKKSGDVVTGYMARFGTSSTTIVPFWYHFFEDAIPEDLIRTENEGGSTSGWAMCGRRTSDGFIAAVDAQGNIKYSKTYKYSPFATGGAYSADFKSLTQLNYSVIGSGTEKDLFVVGQSLGYSSSFGTGILKVNNMNGNAIYATANSLPYCGFTGGKGAVEEYVRIIADQNDDLILIGDQGSMLNMDNSLTSANWVTNVIGDPSYRAHDVRETNNGFITMGRTLHLQPEVIFVETDVVGAATFFMTPNATNRRYDIAESAGINETGPSISISVNNSDYFYYSLTESLNTGSSAWAINRVPTILSKLGMTFCDENAPQVSNSTCNINLSQWQNETFNAADPYWTGWILTNPLNTPPGPALLSGYFTVGTDGNYCFDWQKTGGNDDKEDVQLSQYAEPTIFPNPTNDILNLQFPDEVIGEAKLFDMMGKQVASKMLNGITNEQMSLRNLSNGIYLLQLNANGLQETHRIVKQ